MQVLIFERIRISLFRIIESINFFSKKKSPHSQREHRNDLILILSDVDCQPQLNTNTVYVFTGASNLKTDINEAVGTGKNKDLISRHSHLLGFLCLGFVDLGGFRYL